jgi:hypothetical protein
MKYFIHLIVLIYLKQISNEPLFKSQTQAINGEFFLKNEQINSVQVVENVNYCLKGLCLFLSKEQNKNQRANSRPKDGIIEDNCCY